MSDVLERMEPVSSTAAGHVYVHLDAGATIDVPFLFEQQQKRLPPAFGISAVTHVALFVLAVVLARILPEPVRAFVPGPVNKEIVWLAEPGPGGGGGGGGNETPEPPQKAELPGPDKITVPVAEAPKLDEAKPEEVPKPAEVNIPAKPLGDSDLTLAGVLESLQESTGSQGPGSGGGSGTGVGTGIGSGEGSGFGPGWGGGTGGGAYRPGSGIEIPVVIREVKPQYTADAMRAKIQGTVLLEAIVLTDGSVGKVEVIRSLDSAFGLDQEAVRAARQWRFVPGKRLGQPVPVIVTIELTFTLR